MKKFLITFLLIFNFLSAQEIIPSWFEKLPEPSAGVLYAIGFSGKFVNNDLAREVALNNALIDMAKQKQINMSFYIEEISDGTYNLTNPSYQESYIEDILDEVIMNYSVLDSSITEQGYYILISHPDRSSRVSANDKTWGPKPKWIKKPPQSKKWIYGVGFVANYYSPVRAWKEAGELARFDLGKAIELETESIHAVIRNDKRTIESKIYKQSYNLTLQNSVIVERWYDTQKGRYYALCRAPR